MFQFHSGSIKRCAGYERVGYERVFQFHSGSIKSDQFLGSSNPRGFVSIP